MEAALHTAKKWWPLAVLGVFFMTAALLIAEGYRVAPGARISHLARLTVTGLPRGTELYVDNETVPVVNGTSTIAVLPGSHTLLANASGFSSWNALADAGKGDTIVPSLLVPTSWHITILKGPVKRKAQEAIAKYALPSATSSLAVAGGCATVSVENNALVADAVVDGSCTPPAFLCLAGSCAPTIIYAPIEPIRAAILYPERSDALIVSAGDGVFALSLDPRDPRTEVPLLHARSPMVIASGGGLVGKDGATIFSLSRE